MSASRAAPATLRDQVRSAVIWRSGTQIFGQLVAWASTFLVIRILAPPLFGVHVLAPLVAEFGRRYPRVVLDIHVDSPQVPQAKASAALRWPARLLWPRLTYAEQPAFRARA